MSIVRFDLVSANIGVSLMRIGRPSSEGRRVKNRPSGGNACRGWQVAWNLVGWRHVRAIYGYEAGSGFFGRESVEKLRQFIFRRGSRTDIVAPPSQITSDMLSRHASSLQPPRSQTEPTDFFKKLLGVELARPEADP